MICNKIVYPDAFQQFNTNNFWKWMENAFCACYYIFPSKYIKYCYACNWFNLLKVHFNIFCEKLLLGVYFKIFLYYQLVINNSNNNSQ